MIIQEREKVLNDSQKEAMRIMDDAQKQLERKADDSEIARQAKISAEEILAKAEGIAIEIREGAKGYADDNSGKPAGKPGQNIKPDRAGPLRTQVNEITALLQRFKYILPFNMFIHVFDCCFNRLLIISPYPSAYSRHLFYCRVSIIMH